MSSSTISANPSYRRVSSQDAATLSSSSSSSDNDHRRSSGFVAQPAPAPSAPLQSISSVASTTSTHKPFSERLWDKFIALAWVVVAIVVGHYTRLYQHVLIHPDPRLYRTLLQAAAACFATDLALLVYLMIYLPYGKGLTDSSAWAVYCPRVVPSMTVIGVIGMLLGIRACWPIWGCLSPLILGTQIMGAVFGLHFVPWPC